MSRGSRAGTMGCLPVALWLAGCECGAAAVNGGNEGDPCVQDQDCDTGLACVDRICTRSASCPAGQTPCGAACCLPGQACREGVCGEPCTEVVCGDECCAARETCTPDGCCPPSGVCGARCCPAGEYCESGTCAACPRPPCGAACCRPEETCHGGVCCLPDDVCGADCCADDEVCEMEACHRDCGDLVRCGPAEECCAAGDICYFGECITPGASCTGTWDCPPDEYCDPGLSRCLPRHGTTECEYLPPVGEFNPTVQWSWAGGDVMMTPAVANLTDDDADGTIDENDVPDVVVTTFAGGNYHTNGTLWILSGDDGHEIFHSGSPAIAPGAGVAVADVDRDGSPDIVACKSGGTGLVVFEHDGAVKWDLPFGCDWDYMAAGAPACADQPAVADLEGHGDVEILTDYTIVSAGALRCTGWTDRYRILTAISDVDGDGRLDVVGGNRAMDADCRPLWLNPAVADGYPAVADLDGDGRPEIATVSGSIWVLDGESGNVIWGPYLFSTTGGCGGAPTIADFDGDGKPEVATAALDAYMVFDLDCSSFGDPADCASGRTDGVLWTMPTSDHSSCATGSSVFDFEGDGAAEAVYDDEYYLRIYSGRDGTVLFEVPNSNGTLWDYPLIVDVDNDEHAEIVAVANRYAWGAETGVRVFGDAMDNWVRTRRIWNQHTYHVTNIEEDGAPPDGEVPNWTVPRLNNFRQNVQPEGLLNAPDLVPQDTMVSTRLCPARLVVSTRVLNQGASSAPPGVPVAFYQGTPEGEHTLLEVVPTTRRLMPGESEALSVEFVVPPGGEGVVFDFFVEVDSDATGAGIVHECLEDNNRSPPVSGACEIIG